MNNLVSIEEAKQLVKKEPYLVEPFDINLEAFKILSPENVEISGEQFALDKKAAIGLCNILGVPKKFYKEINIEDEELWEEINVRKQQRLKTKVRFFVNKVLGLNKRYIKGVSLSEIPWIPDDTFLDMLGYILEKYPMLKLRGVYLCQRKLVAQMYFEDKVKSPMEKLIVDNQPDLFSLSFDIENSQFVDFRTFVEMGVERMICTNRARSMEKEFTIKLKHSGSSYGLMQDLYNVVDNVINNSDISFEKFLKEKIKRIINCNASLAELNDAYNIGRSCISDVNDRLPELIEKIQIEEVVGKYGLEFPIKGKSDRWLTTATTPVNLYQLYNDLTFFASNNKILTADEKVELQVKFGSLFFKKSPDLLDIAPRVNWNN